MTTPLPPDLLAALKNLDTCAVSNAIETFQVRLRNEGFANSTVRSVFPKMGTMVGYTATVRVRSSSPPPVGHDYPDRTDWWQHIETVPSPRIVVIEDVDQKVGHGAFIGEMHARILQALGCVGAITNGSARDLPAVEAAGFNLWAGSRSVSHSYVHIVEFGKPVEVGGLTVRPSDLLMADAHGVLSIPPEVAAQIPEAVGRLVEHEHHILQLCCGNRLTASQLKGLVEGVL